MMSISKPANVLVTGANGQLGSCLRARCCFKEPFAHNWVFTGHKDLDITDLKSVREYVNDNDIDIVVNCAAYTNVEAAENRENLHDVYNANVFAPRNLASIMNERRGVLVHISTDYVYRPFQNWDGAPFMEDEDAFTKDVLPFNVYGDTKLSGEKAIKAIGCQHLIIRTSWLYSIYGRNFLTNVHKKIQDAEGYEMFPFVCDQVGSPTSAHALADFIYSVVSDWNVKDEAFGDTFSSDVINYSDDGVCSWYDFAKFINTQMTCVNHVVPCYSDEYITKAKRPPYSVMSKKKIKTDSRYAQHVNIRDWQENVKSTLTRL